MTTKVSLIDDNAVTGAAINNSTITADDIADNAVTSDKLQSGGNDNDRAVTTNHIKDKAVTPAKLSTGGPSWTTEGVVSAALFSGDLAGNVTGNVTGNATSATTADSCTGNSATATTAGSVTNGVYTNNFPNNFSGTGYQQFPGGFIIQWGTSSSLSQQDQFQSFAISFPGAVFSVLVTPNGGGGNAGNKRDHWLALGYQLNGFTLRSYFESGAASYSWVAFGA